MENETNIYDISKEILIEEDCEDHEYFEYLVDESNCVNALEFFELKYDAKKHTITIPEAFDYILAINIINQYLERVEANGEHILPTDSITIPERITEKEDYIYRVNQEAKRYDEHTYHSRGADDGTFDYAGTYMISILCVLLEHSKKRIPK